MKKLLESNKFVAITILTIAMLSACAAEKNQEVLCSAQTNQVEILTNRVSQLEAEAVQKDKKIVWLREQAKKAGANLNGNTNVNK